MSRKIDTYQFALFIESLDVAPSLFALRNSRTLNFNIIEGAEQRVESLLFLSLIVLTVTHHDIDKAVTLGILGKEILTTDAKAIKASTQR